MGISASRIKYVTKETALVVKDLSHLRTSDVISNIVTPLLTSSAFNDARKALQALNGLRSSISGLVNTLDSLNVSNITATLLGNLDATKLGSMAGVINQIKNMDQTVVNQFLRATMGRVTEQLYENPALLDEFKDITTNVSSQILLKALKDFSVDSNRFGDSVKNEILNRLLDEVPSFDRLVLNNVLTAVSETAALVNQFGGSTSSGSTISTPSIPVTTGDLVTLYKALAYAGAASYYRHSFAHQAEMQIVKAKITAGALVSDAELLFLSRAANGVTEGYPYTGRAILRYLTEMIDTAVGDSSTMTSAGVNAFLATILKAVQMAKLTTGIVSIKAEARAAFETNFQTWYKPTYPGGPVYTVDERRMQFLTVYAYALNKETSRGQELSIQSVTSVALYCYLQTLDRALGWIQMNSANSTPDEVLAFVKTELKCFASYSLINPRSDESIKEERVFSEVAYPLASWMRGEVTAFHITNESKYVESLNGNTYQVHRGYMRLVVALLSTLRKSGLSLVAPTSASEADKTVYQRLSAIRASLPAATTAYVPTTPTDPLTAPAGYTAVLGPTGESTGFRTRFNPSQLPVDPANGCYVLGYIAGNNSPERLKFFFPPGTRMFTANFLVYLSQMESKGIMRMNAAPTGPALIVSEGMANSADNSGGPSGGLFNETILENLLNGRQAYFYGSPGAGLMPISYGGALITPTPTSGGYVYCNFQYPGGVLGATQWTVYVDVDVYTAWYESASWDNNGNPLESVMHTSTSQSSSSTPTVPPIANWPESDPRRYLTDTYPNPDDLIKLITPTAEGAAALRLVNHFLKMMPDGNPLGMSDTDRGLIYGKTLDGVTFNSSTLAITYSPVQ